MNITDVPEVRRHSVASFDGSYGMGDVTRTPCDATINITTEYYDSEEVSSNLMNHDNAPSGECCKHKSARVSEINSTHGGYNTTIEYEKPPAYYSQEGSTNNDDRSDGDSGVSNSKYTISMDESDQHGVKMAKLDQNGKLFSSL